LKKALIADDTKYVRILLTTCLESNGYTVLSAKNGIEAIDLVERESFDIAFIDVEMPELNGIDVLRSLRDLGLTYPVVMMTMGYAVRNGVECTRLGAIAYLKKPIKADKIIEIINLIDEEKAKQDDISALIKQSNELFDKNNTEEALKLLKKGLSIDISNGEIYYLLGKAFEKNNSKVDATKFFSAAEVFGYKF
jgi:two-component system, OmpR family, response regulator